jgi:N-acetyl-gamma-glutamyl-phosphate reductase
MTTAVRTTAAVIGATGYAGATTVALLQRHPHVDVIRVTSRSNAGRRMADVYPGIDCNLELVAETDPGDAEVVFVALPHGMAGALAGSWLSQGRTVVDLGADFRLEDPGVYERWYGKRHPAPELLKNAVLGLPEMDRGGTLPGATLIACPGCYSTAAVVAATPALAGGGVVKPDVIVDAASGVSGAGRSVALDLHFGEANEDFKAYGVTGHRHVAEMEQVFATANNGDPVRVTFVPHLVPMTRGILATCYMDLAPGSDFAGLRAAYDSYADCPFIKMTDQPPRTKEVVGTNECHIHVTQQGDRVVVLAAIDNLVKGAAGQAVQSLNMVMGWPETDGLELPVRWP